MAHSIRGRSQWSDNRFVWRPSIVVGLNGRLWLRMRPRGRASVIVGIAGPWCAMVVRIPGPSRIPGVVMSRHARSERSVLDHIDTAASGDVLVGWPGHGGRNKLGFGWRVDAVVIAAVGGTHVFEGAASRHPGPGYPLPISLRPKPAALHPQRVGTLGCYHRRNLELPARRSRDDSVALARGQRRWRVGVAGESGRCQQQEGNCA